LTKIKESQQILSALGMPKGQQNSRSALILLALSNLKTSSKWIEAQKVCMSVVGNKTNAKYAGIMRFIAKHYHKHYAENSRETFRRHTLHQFVQAGVVELNPEDPNLATNSKDNHYCLTDEALDVIRAFGSTDWMAELAKFVENKGTLTEKYSRNRSFRMVSVKIADGRELTFSPGKHNDVQIAVIEEFAPRFAPGCDLVYVGDTANKDLFVDEEALNTLSIQIDEHNKLPDIVLYSKKRNLLFLIEAVTSHGPVSAKRIIELDRMLKTCHANRVYVSAFPDFKEFKRHSSSIAWETEVWIMEIPEHMIHFNGDKFIGPR
jgi:type II restriction enzyme